MSAIDKFNFKLNRKQAASQANTVTSLPGTTQPD